MSAPHDAAIEDEFASAENMVLCWLAEEREAYQTRKFDYDDELELMALGFEPDSMGDGKSYIERQVMNYLHRAKVFGLDTPQGRQAWMKLCAAVTGQAEQIARVHGIPPRPGVPSGTIEEWDE